MKLEPFTVTLSYRLKSSPTVTVDFNFTNDGEFTWNDITNHRFPQNRDQFIMAAETHIANQDRYSLLTVYRDVKDNDLTIE